MLNRGLPKRRQAALALAACAWAATFAAAAAEAPAPLGAELVKTGLYLLTGGGANTLMRLSASGTVLVDGKLPASHRALMSQTRKISKLSDLPVRVLFVTDHYPQHRGDPALWRAAGVVMVAQRNALQRLGGDTPASAAASNLLVGFDSEYTLKIGGVEVRALHFGPAQTDDAVVVHFQDLKVVAIGDLYGTDAPEPDPAAGGSWLGWGRVLDQVLKLDFDLAVPSAGPPLSRAELAAYKARLDTVTARARALVRQREPADGAQAGQLADGLGWPRGIGARQRAALWAELAAEGGSEPAPAGR